MPKSKMCQTQSMKDAQLDAIIVSRLLALGSTEKTGAALGVTGHTVRNWINHGPKSMSWPQIRAMNRELRKVDPTLVLPMEVYG